MSHGFSPWPALPQVAGEGQINREPCRACRGEGRQRAERLLSVKIPAGIDDGMQLRLTGEGSAVSTAGPRRPLRARAPPRARRCSPATAPTFTATFRSPSPSSPSAPRSTCRSSAARRAEDPAGTQPGHVLRLRGKGMPHLRRSGHGDACYRLVLEVPQKLNARQREALASVRGGLEGRARAAGIGVLRADEEAPRLSRWHPPAYWELAVGVSPTIRKG